MQLKFYLLRSLVCFLASHAVFSASAGARDVDLKPDYAAPYLGLTYDKETLPDGSSSAKLNGAMILASSLAYYVNVHVMGWGADNPEPAPGVFRFESLDRRISQIRTMKAVPVITLCCAPDWMKGGVAGKTDWSSLERAPDRSHYKDFADLAEAVARRYPDVHYFQVWNEFKGFWDAERNRWAYENYVEFYNIVYERLKSVSPLNRVGGPYAPLRLEQHAAPQDPRDLVRPYGTISGKALEALEFWLKHKAGADFISIDGALFGENSGPYDIFSALNFYDDVLKWIRRESDLPIWWSEWYSGPFDNSYGARVDHRQMNALLTATLVHLSHGSQVALRWGPEEHSEPPYEAGGQDALWSSTSVSTPLHMLPFGTSVQNFEACFPPGSHFSVVSAVGTSVLIASSRKCSLVINETPLAQHSVVRERNLMLQPFEVRFIQNDRAYSK